MQETLGRWQGDFVGKCPWYLGCTSAIFPAEKLKLEEPGHVKIENQLNAGDKRKEINQLQK
jgi:hypothetical protein